jgi:hypothetical protein
MTHSWRVPCACVSLPGGRARSAVHATDCATESERYARLRALAANFLCRTPEHVFTVSWLCGNDYTGEWPLTPKLCEVLQFDVTQHCPPLPLQLEPLTVDTVHTPTSRASTELN